MLRLWIMQSTLGCNVCEVCDSKKSPWNGFMRALLCVKLPEGLACCKARALSRQCCRRRRHPSATAAGERDQLSVPLREWSCNPGGSPFQPSAAGLRLSCFHHVSRTCRQRTLLSQYWLSSVRSAGLLSATHPGVWSHQALKVQLEHKLTSVDSTVDQLGGKTVGWVLGQGKDWSQSITSQQKVGKSRSWFKITALMHHYIHSGALFTF